MTREEADAIAGAVWNHDTALRLFHHVAGQHVGTPQRQSMPGHVNVNVHQALIDRVRAARMAGSVVYTEAQRQDLAEALDDLAEAVLSQVRT